MSRAAGVLDATPAVRVIEGILDVLRDGPQSPCHLDRHIGVSETQFHAYLAELLARGWVKIVIDRLVQSDKDSDELNQRLSSIYDSERHLREDGNSLDRLQRLTLFWQALLENLWHEKLTQFTLIVLTAAGVRAIPTLSD